MFKLELNLAFETYAIRWDGQESSVEICNSPDNCNHGEHYASYAKARDALVKHHRIDAVGYAHAARTWRRITKKQWLKDYCETSPKGETERSEVGTNA